MKKKDQYYLLPDRLNDVIRLLVLLAVDKYNFRTEAGTQQRLQGSPNSTNSWLSLAKDHPEFFRLNKEKTSFILLLRYIQKADVEEGEIRDPLTIEETQKLIDQAIALHDKQLARYQRDSSKAAVTAAYIAAGATVVVGIISLISTVLISADLKSDLEIIKEKLENMKSIQQNIPDTIYLATPNKPYNKVFNKKK